jgi:hypothetical protein
MTMRWLGMALLTLAAAMMGCSDCSTCKNHATAEGEAYVLSAPLNLLAKSTWEYRLNEDEWTTDALIVPADFQGEISARIRFDVTQEQLDATTCLQIEQLTNERIRLMDVNYLLNGQMVVPPVMERGYFLDTVYGVSTDFLQAGENELAFTVRINNGPEPKPFWTMDMKLLAMPASELTFRTGPIVSAIYDRPDLATTYFMITGEELGNDRGGVWIMCRTNMPAEVQMISDPAALNDNITVTQEGVLMAPSVGMVHRFWIPLPADLDKLTYTLEATTGDVTTTSGPHTIYLWDETKPLRFVFTGDTQKNPDAWGAIAELVAAEEPVFVASVGDMNEDGLFDWRWDPELFTPGATLFATTPFYPGVGNHEVNYNSHYGNRDAHCVILDDFFVMPENHLRHSWAQQFGPVLIVSFEGHRDFSPGTELYDWLRNTLEGAGKDVDYIFLMNHYPAWSASGYMNLAEDGSEPRWYVDAKQMQDIIIPLALEYNATALIVGHDHFYQRSELPDGLTQVLTGTSGSGGGEQDDVSAGANPYAVIGRGGYHYCVFDITDDSCVMTVKNIDGEVIDTRTWAPRELPATD